MNKIIAALTALVATLALAGTAQAQQPPVQVTPKILTKDVKANSCKAKLRVTVKVPGLLTNTLESEWVTVYKLQKPKPFSIQFPTINVSGSFTYTGSEVKLTAKASVQVGAYNQSKSFTTSAKVEVK